MEGVLPRPPRKCDPDRRSLERSDLGVGVGHHLGAAGLVALGDVERARPLAANLPHRPKDAAVELGAAVVASKIEVADLNVDAHDLGLGESRRGEEEGRSSDGGESACDHVLSACFIGCGAGLADRGMKTTLSPAPLTFG
jgi:hypothetical protein